MDKPRAPKPANATIQIDRLDLDEILLVDTSDQATAGPAASVPPPLPPEEIARAGAVSMAPIGSVAPAPPPSSSRKLVFGVVFVVGVGAAIAAGVLVGGALRGTAPAATASSAVVTPAKSSAAAAPTAATNTITMQTLELGGKTKGDE